MRSIGAIVAAAGLCLGSPAEAGFGFPVQVKGVSRLGSTGQIFLLVESGRGAGGVTQGVLRITCAAERMTDAHYRAKVKGSSKASTPKKWRPPSPRLGAIRPILPATLLSTPADSNGWVPVGLASAEGLCPAAQQALRKAQKS